MHAAAEFASSLSMRLALDDVEHELIEAPSHQDHRGLNPHRFTDQQSVLLLCLYISAGSCCTVHEVLSFSVWFNDSQLLVHFGNCGPTTTFWCINGNTILKVTHKMWTAHRETLQHRRQS